MSTTCITCFRDWNSYYTLTIFTVTITNGHHDWGWIDTAKVLRTAACLIPCTRAVMYATIDDGWCFCRVWSIEVLFRKKTNWSLPDRRVAMLYHSSLQAALLVRNQAQSHSVLQPLTGSGSAARYWKERKRKTVFKCCAYGIQNHVQHCV
jgi:hypothetical protein